MPRPVRRDPRASRTGGEGIPAGLPHRRRAPAQRKRCYMGLVPGGLEQPHCPPCVGAGQITESALTRPPAPLLHPCPASLPSAACPPLTTPASQWCVAPGCHCGRRDYHLRSLPMARGLPRGHGGSSPASSGKPLSASQTTPHLLLPHPCPGLPGLECPPPALHPVSSLATLTFDIQLLGFKRVP